MEHEILVCKCSNFEHQIIVSIDTEDKEAYLHIHLSKLSFFKRLAYGIRYILGKQSRYGAFQEVILQKEHAPVLRDLAIFLWQ